MDKYWKQAARHFKLATEMRKKGANTPGSAQAGRVAMLRQQASDMAERLRKEANES